MKCRMEDIGFIETLKKGMTNHSFLFSVNGKKYIFRMPGEGTEQLINRKHEADVFRKISGYGLCNDPVYIDPKSGCKITLFLDHVRTCNPESRDDVARCMKMLRRFHDLKLTVAHTFDIFEKIAFYESLWNRNPSIFPDYEETKKRIFEKQSIIENMKKDFCLAHIDAVCDNFLFFKSGEKEKEDLQLIDWEYAGMQDPHVDLAMFSLYSYYTKEQVDELMEIYFGEDPGEQIRSKIYYYVAACGLLWSNWAEYKRMLGIEFGSYGNEQYRCAKEFIHYCSGMEKTSG